jgi:hypothetical protein
MKYMFNNSRRNPLVARIKYAYTYTINRLVSTDVVTTTTTDKIGSSTNTPVTTTTTKNNTNHNRIIDTEQENVTELVDQLLERTKQLMISNGINKSQQLQQVIDQRNNNNDKNHHHW